MEPILMSYQIYRFVQFVIQRGLKESLRVNVTENNQLIFYFSITNNLPKNVNNWIEIQINKKRSEMKNYGI